MCDHHETIGSFTYVLCDVFFDLELLKAGSNKLMCECGHFRVHAGSQLFDDNIANCWGVGTLNVTNGQNVWGRGKMAFSNTVLWSTHLLIFLIEKSGWKNCSTSVADICKERRRNNKQTKIISNLSQKVQHQHGACENLRSSFSTSWMNEAEN